MMTKRQLQRRTRSVERSAKKRWKHLGRPERAMMVGGAVIQIGLLVAAQTDIARRPAEQIRGNKLLWRIVVLINFIGPLTYFVWGRKKEDCDDSEQSTVSAVA